MGALIAFALNLGIPARFAKSAVITTLVVIAVTVFGVSKCAYDKSVIDKHEAKLERRAAPATDKAASERANDAISNAKHEQELHDVIAAQPDQPIAPTSRALACARLRQRGHAPASCG